jgi:hypothetical protein
MSERLVRWIVFGVLIALLPIAFRYALESTTGPVPSLAHLLADGELLLISSAIAAGAVGELIGRGRNRLILQLISAGGCIATVLFASLYYAYVATHQLVNEAFVMRMSLFLFGLTLIASASCIALAASER